MVNNTEDKEQVNTVSVQNLASRVAFNLRGALTSTADSYAIEVENKERDNFLRHSLRYIQDKNVWCNIITETGSHSEKAIYIRSDHRDVMHLYVTWDTPKLITYCYCRNDRYYVINLKSDTTVIMSSGKDRRDNESQAVDPAKLRERRTFYHIGKIIDEVEMDIEETEDTEESDVETPSEEQEELDKSIPPEN